ncbi:hypothetical protein HRbin15_01366 [bacterium HR15]|nr:hypothetical protein HRbin15_01366 [bacterium HR15]
MVCTKCFAEIPDTSAFCMECGARLREDTTDPLYAEGSDREVYPEIARANLLRMKGQYEEAIEVCLHILKRYPSNETAHALLGDIYADQGKLTDAIQWYELLVELAPNNPVYRSKLENLRSIQTAQQAQATTPPPASPVRVPSTRVWVYTLWGLLALILIGSVFVAGRRMTLSTIDYPASAAHPKSQTNLPSPAEPPSNASPIPPPAPSTESDSQAVNNLPSFNGMGDMEERFARAISQQLNGLPIWCLFDPLTNRWTIRTRIQVGALTRGRVMQESLLVAAAAFKHAPSLQSVIVMILTPSTGGADTLLFAAEISRAMLPPDVRTLNEAQVEAMFQSINAWWNPAVPLPEGSSPAVPGAPQGTGEATTGMLPSEANSPS